MLDSSREKPKRRSQNGVLIAIIIMGLAALLTLGLVLANDRQQFAALAGTATAIQLTNAEADTLRLIPTATPTLSPPTALPTLTPTPTAAGTTLPDRPNCPMSNNTREDNQTKSLVLAALRFEAFDLPFDPRGIEVLAYGEDYHCGDPRLTPTPIFVPLIPRIRITLRLTENEMENQHYKGGAIRDILWALRDVPLANVDTITVVFRHENNPPVEWEMTYSAAYEALNDGLAREELYQAGEMTEETP